MATNKQQLFDKVKAYFNGDANRTWMWFNAPNSNLGGISPLEVMRVGRANKLAAYIDEARKGVRKL